MDLLIGFIVLLLLLYVLMMFLLKWLKGAFVSPADKKFFQKHWQQILKEKDARSKIMEADKLIDQMLKKRGYQGSLSDKLKKHGSHFTDLNNLWFAHKLRNKIAHEMGFIITEKELIQAMRGFSKAFKDLGLLE